MQGAIVVSLVLFSAVAVAQEPATPPPPASPGVEQVSASPQTPGPGEDWSLHSGKTMGKDQSAISGEAGWPGVQTEYMFGLQPFLDLGARFEFDWSFLGDLKNTAPGIKIQGIIRLHLLDAGNVVMSLRFEPGFLTFFFGGGGGNALAPGPGPITLARSPRQITLPPEGNSSSGGTQFGITLPVALEFGLPVSPGFLLNAKVAVPFTLTFGDSGGTVIPLMLGVGMEYRLQPRLALIADLAAGPIFYVSGSTQFALQAQVGVAYRL